MKYFIVLSLIIIIISACTTTHIIKPGEEFTFNKTAKLIYKDGEKVYVDSFRVIKDSVYIHTKRFNEEWCFHSSEMDRLIVKYVGKGALWGAVSSGLCGAAIGAVFHPKGVPFVEGEAGPYSVGIYSGVIGFLVGIFKGKKEIYVFQTNEYGYQTINNKQNQQDYLIKKTIKKVQLSKK